MWTLDDALPLVRKIAPIAKRNGFSVALYGSVLEEGKSENDLDLFFLLDCRQISPTEDVTSWVRPNCRQILTYHGIGAVGWAPISVNEFNRQMEELVKLRDAGKLRVITFKDGGQRLRNLSLHSWNPVA